MDRRRRSLLALPLLLGGCSVLPASRADPPTLHVLLAEPQQTAAPRRATVIEVATPRAAAGFDTAQMAYVERRYELDYFATHRWIDSPSRMLATLLVRALEQTNAFAAVVTPSSGVAADIRLDTEIVRLQQDFATRPSRAEVALRAQLTNARARRVIATRVFEEEELAPTDDAAGGVVAANTALQRILARLVAFCLEGSSPV
jgi:cholesterol transport system auxiliary component